MSNLQMLRVREICALLKVSRVTLWAWRRAGRFPEPVKLGPHVVAWPEHVIQEWLSSRASISTQEAKA